MEVDGPLDEQGRENIEAWNILWEVRELIRSVPIAKRRWLMEQAIREAHASNGYNAVFEQEVRDFMADALVEGE